MLQSLIGSTNVNAIVARKILSCGLCYEVVEMNVARAVHLDADIPLQILALH